LWAQIAHVLPEFQSPLGHMRSKAAWVAGQYAEIEFKGNNFQVLLQCIVRGLRDAELPVRVDSVVALRTFVDAMQNLDDIRPILPHLLDELFRLMSEVSLSTCPSQKHWLESLRRLHVACSAVLCWYIGHREGCLGVGLVAQRQPVKLQAAKRFTPAGRLLTHPLTRAPSGGSVELEGCSVRHGCW